MAQKPTDLDLSNAVKYHYDRFPPTSLDYQRLMAPLAGAAAALARYDQMLRTLHNSEILLAPLRSKEAVISSRMEGTVTTLDEVLRYEADQDSDEDNSRPVSSETLEVVSYQRAMKMVQMAMSEGRPLSEHMIRSAHRLLLRFVRGGDKRPGEFKTEQNYLADRSKREILFIPISPERLRDGLDALSTYVNKSDEVPLLKIAISHVEFEALHPFNDGNGRIGRMIITLLLWEMGVISQPHFYVSEYLEGARDEYIERMRNVSKDDAWTEWCGFFLNGLTQQAHQNLMKADEISALYEEMKGVFRDMLSSPWASTALDWMFAQPVFRNNKFTNKSGIPRATAARFSRILYDEGLLKMLSPPSGRRAAMYSFEPLLNIVRD